MKYDASLIEIDYVEIDGKKIKFEKIPTGMNGPNGPISTPIDQEEEEDFTKIFADNPGLYKEYTEYVDEGEEPDSDEVRAIKEEIEKDQTEGILDTIDLEEEVAVS